MTAAEIVGLSSKCNMCILMKIMKSINREISDLKKNGDKKIAGHESKK